MLTLNKRYDIISLEKRKEQKMMKKAVVINETSSYFGVEGEATDENVVGNVMFYPKDSYPVYRVCLKRSDIDFI